MRPSPRGAIAACIVPLLAGVEGTGGRASSGLRPTARFRLPSPPLDGGRRPTRGGGRIRSLRHSGVKAFDGTARPCPRNWKVAGSRDHGRGHCSVRARPPISCSSTRAVAADGASRIALHSPIRPSASRKAMPWSRRKEGEISARPRLQAQANRGRALRDQRDGEGAKQPRETSAGMASAFNLHRCRRYGPN